MGSQNVPAQRFKANPVYLAPIVTSLIIGVLCTSLFLLSSLEPTPIVINPEEGLGPLWNSLFFVAMAGLGATMIYLLMKYKKFKLINVLIATAFSLITFILSFLYTSMIVIILNAQIWGLDLWVIGLSIGVTAISIAGVFWRRGAFHEIIVIILGGALGSFLGVSIPTVSAVLILLFLAVYDVFAVYRGPVGKLAVEGLEKLRGVTFSFKDVQVGLGDLTFYSMLVSHVLLNFGYKSGLGAFLGISVGSFLSFKMLERKGMFPGLPFSIVLGLLAAYLGSLI